MEKIRNMEDTKNLIKDSMELLEGCNVNEKEMDAMNKDIEFLQNEYKTNKRYFRYKQGRCTVDDVIKTVFEFAWRASKRYHS